jgi:hypothetical protein
MGKLGTIDFKGASGKSYTFTVYPWGTTFKAVGAVYVVTRRYPKSSGDGHSHEVLYVGQTGDLSARLEDHHKAECFEENQANCVCVKVEEVETTRLEIEKDLIDNYNPPCNE